MASVPLLTPSSIKYVYPSMATPFAKGLVILTGNSSPDLAREVASRVGVSLSKADVTKDSCSEVHVAVGESVRGRDVFIIQSGCGNCSVNDLIMEMLILCYACKTSSARKIIGVIPYLPYSQHCFMRKRGCITAKLLASMLTKAGLNHLVTMDLFHKEIQGFYNFTVDNLRGSLYLVEHIKHNIPDYVNGVVVARYPGVARRANSFAERLRLKLAVIHGAADVIEDSRNSPPPGPQQEPDFTPFRTRVASKKALPMYVVGDVEGKTAFLIDDEIDEVEDLVSAAQCLKDSGARKIYAVATHALLSGNAPLKIQESVIDEMLVTNTIPQEEHAKVCSKITTVDISNILAEAIRRIYHGESMSFLFQNIPMED